MTRFHGEIYIRGHPYNNVGHQGTTWFEKDVEEGFESRG